MYLIRSSQIHVIWQNYAAPTHNIVMIKLILTVSYTKYMYKHIQIDKDTHKNKHKRHNRWTQQTHRWIHKHTHTDGHTNNRCIFVAILNFCIFKLVEVWNSRYLSKNFRTLTQNVRISESQNVRASEFQKVIILQSQNFRISKSQNSEI